METCLPEVRCSVRSDKSLQRRPVSKDQVVHQLDRKGLDESSKAHGLDEIEEGKVHGFDGLEDGFDRLGGRKDEVGVEEFRRIDHVSSSRFDEG